MYLADPPNVTVVSSRVSGGSQQLYLLNPISSISFACGVCVCSWVHLSQAAARLAIQKPSRRHYQYDRHGYDLPLYQLSREARHYFITPDMVNFISSYLLEPYLVVSEVHVNSISTLGRKQQDVHWDYLGCGVLTYMLMLNPSQGRRRCLTKRRPLRGQSHFWSRDGMADIHLCVCARVW